MNYFNKIIKKIKEKLFNSPGKSESPSLYQEKIEVGQNKINKSNDTVDVLIENELPNIKYNILSEPVFIEKEPDNNEPVIDDKQLAQSEERTIPTVNSCSTEKLILVSDIITLISIISNHRKVKVPKNRTSNSKKRENESKVLEEQKITSITKILEEFEIDSPQVNIDLFNSERGISSTQYGDQTIKDINKNIVSYYRDGKKHILTMTNLTPRTKNNEQDGNLNSRLNIIDEGNTIKITKQALIDDTTNNTTDLENPLGFLDELFETDLDKIITSKDFIERASTLIEVPNYKDNKEYISDFQANEENSEEALEMLVYANKRLVLKIVSKYKGLANHSFTEDDMFQNGMIGLMTAARKFDLNKEFEFSTYATHWIRQGITRGIMDQSSTIRVPVHMRELINKVTRMERESYSNFGLVDYEWIASELESPIEKVIDAVRVQNSFMRNTSLDTPVGIDGATALGELIEDVTMPNPDKLIIDKSLQSTLYSLLETLKPRERDVIIKRFGLDGQEPRTLESISKDYDVTRERIRQIESKALRRLKHPNRIEKLKEYYEV